MNLRFDQSHKLKSNVISTEYNHLVQASYLIQYITVLQISHLNKHIVKNVNF